MAEKEKPMCPIIGANGNIFNILGIASRTLRNNDMADAANEMYSRVTSPAAMRKPSPLLWSTLNLAARKKWKWVCSLSQQLKLLLIYMYYSKQRRLGYK